VSFPLKDKANRVLAYRVPCRRSSEDMIVRNVDSIELSGFGALELIPDYRTSLCKFFWINMSCTSFIVTLRRLVSVAFVKLI
jgi:hypothetical protein